MARTQDAIQGWKTTPFAPFYHQTGYIVATSGHAPQKAVDSLQKSLASVASNPAFQGDIEPLNEPSDFRKCAWQLCGPLEGHTGYFNRLAGYAHSGNALKAVHEYCTRRGVLFLLGERAGNVAALLYDEDGRCVGLRTADNSVHVAQRTICATGAYGASLIPALGKFTTARSWSVAHVQLTSREADLLRGLPVVNVRDLGFFFEPDPETRLFKLCPLGGGFTNTTDGTSQPPAAGEAPRDFIPAEDEFKLRRLLRETLPWMAERPFVDKKLCWFSDTRDSDYCVDFVPGSHRSLVVLAGDSGHGFKMMPIVGKWVLDLLAKGRQELTRWQWRHGDASDGDWDGSVSWRIGASSELSDVITLQSKL